MQCNTNLVINLSDIKSKNSYIQWTYQWRTSCVLYVCPHQSYCT